VRHALLLLLATLATGCPRPYRVEAPPRERSARQLTSELRELWRKGAHAPLARLFAPECRAGCTGFVPTPTRLLGERVTGQWWPRMLAGTLVGDLLLVRRSYARIDRLELEPVAARVYHLEVVLRARLLCEGRDPAGRRLRDRGLLDLRLRETPAGLRIASFAPRRVLREVTLLPAERDERVRRTEAGSRPTTEEPASSPSLDELGPDPEPATEPTPSRPRLGELEVVRDGKTLRLRVLGGKRATLLLVTGSAPSPAVCEELARAVRVRAKVAAAILLLGRATPRGACALPILGATARTRRALDWLRPLLPALLLLDGEGELRRVAGEGAGRLGLLEALDRL
jgi:hypothetical protein